MSDIRVLVVEDEPLLAEAHSAYTERVPGFVVVGMAHTARAAMAALRANDGGDVDLVLLDFRLPDLHGLDVCRALRAAGSSVDVLAVTSARDLAVVRTAVSLGVTHYLLKPFTFAAFRDKLERYADYRAQALADGEVAAQHEVDQMFATLRGTAGHSLPKGLDAQTLDRVRAALTDGSRPEVGLSATEVSALTGISRVTARRYLEYLVTVDRAARTPVTAPPAAPRSSTAPADAPPRRSCTFCGDYWPQQRHFNNSNCKIDGRNGGGAATTPSRSGNLTEVVAVVEDDPHPGAERSCISAQRRDLVGLQITVLDLADPTGRDTHQLGHLPLGQAQPLPLFGKMEGADPRLGTGTFYVERFIVPVVQLSPNVVPVMEVAHQPSLRFLSKASQPSYAISATGIALSYHRFQSPALFPATSSTAWDQGSKTNNTRTATSLPDLGRSSLRLLMVEPLRVSTSGRPRPGPLSASMSIATLTDRYVAGSVSRRDRNQSRTCVVVLIAQRRGGS